MKIPNLMKCCICSHNNGQTQIKIHSSCFDKPIIIKIDSEDTNFEIIENLLMLLQRKKEKEELNVTDV
jgi:hypothetical protein